jgi:AAHS family 4-hydroxybenzoate transporter-like MFS transporter
MASQTKADLESLVDSSPLSPFQVSIAVICGLVAMIDGFDTQSIALAAPLIAAAWHTSPASFGLVFGAGLFGSFVGAMTFGVFADRYGRKLSLLLAILLFGVVCLITPFATSAQELLWLRFITGLGLGGALPGIISITSEYAPRRMRATVVSLMFCGFPLGAVIGGVAASNLLPTYGWKSLFYIGAAIPLALLPVIAAVVPESIRFLAVRKDAARVERILTRMGLADRWDGTLAAAAPEHRTPIFSLFAKGRALGTVLLSIILLLSLLLTYFLVNWLPLLARQSGISLKFAVLAVAALNGGSIPGCLIMGRIIDRSGPTVPIAVGYFLGAVAIMGMGLAGGSGPLLLALAFLAGVFSIGAQMCAVALCATFYETALRATGVGWVMGTGRIGAIVGPVIGGLLIAAGMSTPRLFVIGGGVSIAAALTVCAMGFFVLRRKQAGGALAVGAASNAQ